MSDTAKPVPGSVRENTDTREAVRQAIRAALGGLRERLGHFEQTTHGATNPPTLTSRLVGLSDALALCYYEPNAYSISELAQRIDHLLRG